MYSKEDGFFVGNRICFYVDLQRMMLVATYKKGGMFVNRICGYNIEGFIKFVFLKKMSDYMQAEDVLLPKCFTYKGIG